MTPRLPSLTSVLACLLLSAAAVLATEPWAKSRASGWHFEANAQADRSGVVQLYYDTGSGMSEAESKLEPIEAGRPALLKFELPYGRIKGLRFDPLDRDVRMTLGGARVTDGSGRTVVAFAPGQFQAMHEIASLAPVGGGLRIETDPAATDPQTWINLPGPISIPRPPFWRDVAPVFAGALAILVALSLAWGSPGLGLAGRSRTLWASACARPGRSLAAAALAATLAANYPVALGGRSLVSPNIGIALLYGQSPWLPGNRSGEVGDAHAADVDALMWQHVPWSVDERRALLADGELPLWNRYDSAGVPLLGQGQSCLGDPLHVIPLLAGGAAWAWDLKFLLAKWIFAAAVGFCVWRMSRHLPTAMLAAVSAPFIGFFVYRINHPAIFSVCYAPLILYAWLRCLEAPSARAAARWLAALIGANWMEMNSGTAKEAYILLLSMNFSGLCLLALDTRPLRGKAALLAALAVAGALFAMISAPVWCTFYHALGSAYTSYGSAEAFQIQPGMLLGLFDEAFYRPFQINSGVINPSANAFVLTGLIWLAVRWRSALADRRIAALAVSSLPALALVFGVVSPALIARVPFLRNIMHVDNTFSCALVVILCILSGLGWREAWARLATEEGKREAALVVATFAVLFCAFLGTAQSVLRSAYAPLTWGRAISVAPFIRAYGWSLVAGAALFLWALGRMRRRGAATPALLLVALTAFGAFHWREALRTGGGFADYVVRPGPRTDLLAESPAVGAVRGRSPGPFRVVGFHDDLLPGWSGAYGLEGISGPDALMNPFYRELMEAAGVKRTWDWRYGVEAPDVARVKPVFDLLGVRDYLGYRLGAGRPGPELALAASSDMDVYESRDSWPRAFFTDGAAVYGDAAQFVSWVKAGDGKPFVGIQAGDWAKLSPAPRVSGDLRRRRVVAAQGYRLTSNTTSFSVAAPGPGFIVLSEAYETGNFRATVNGRPVPYIRVNHAFKGVYVDSAGTYQVRYEYWPAGFSASLAVSAAGLALMGLALLAAVRAARRGPGESLP